MVLKKKKNLELYFLFLIDCLNIMTPVATTLKFHLLNMFVQHPSKPMHDQITFVHVCPMIKG